MALAPARQAAAGSRHPQSNPPAADKRADPGPRADSGRPGEAGAPFALTALARQCFVHVLEAGGKSVSRQALADDLASALDDLAQASPSPGVKISAGLDAALTELVEAGWLARSEAAAVALAPDALDRLKAGYARKKRGARSETPASAADWAKVVEAASLMAALDLGGRDPLGSDAGLRAQIAKADGLRARILKQAYDLPGKADVPKRAELENGLAVRAIERAGGIAVLAELTGPVTLSPNLRARLIPLLLADGEPPAKLADCLAALAQQAVGAAGRAPDALRQALIYRAICRDLGSDRVATQSAEDRALMAFSQAVLAIARTHATGWAGSRRAFISQVWADWARRADTATDQDEAAFKEQLVAAHRAGLLRLTAADLRDPATLHHVKASATAYKNVEWHLIRIED